MDGERPSTFDQTNSDVFLKTVLSSGLTREQEIKKEKKKKVLALFLSLVLDHQGHSISY